jgi:hypothetical protein
LLKVDVDNSDDDYDPELAHWLEDSGRRHAIRLEESPEALIKYLEELTGRRLTCRQDILSYFTELEAKDAEREQARAKRRVLRESAFLAALVFAAGQYYFWDLNLQISKLQKVYYFAPAATTPGTRRAIPSDYRAAQRAPLACLSFNGLC